MSIIISRGGKNTQRVSRATFGLEDQLQRFIHENPESIPIDEIKDGLRLLILVREFPTGSGPIDALGIDQDGNLYIIETKLYKNADKRRVLAQILDYGASLWKTYEDSTDFFNALEHEILKNTSSSLTSIIQNFYGLDDEAATFIITKMRANLVEGAFKFIVLMDYLEDRLKDLITFMNHNSTFDVFGVEMEFYRFEDFEIMIPKLYGTEAKKTSRGRQTKVWDEQSFFEDAQKRLTAPQVLSLRKLYEFSQEWADQITWGSSANKGSFNPKAATIHPGKAIYTVYSDGLLELNLGWVRDYDQAIPIVEALSQGLRKLELFSVADRIGEKDMKIVPKQWIPQIEQIIAILRSVVPQRPTNTI